MKKWIGIVAMLFLIGAPVHAEQVWTFEPILPMEGSTEWEAKVNVKFNHFDLESIVSFMVLPPNLSDEEIEQYFTEQLTEVQAALDALETQTAVQQVRINWRAHPDPNMRTFEMHAAVGGIEGVYSTIPDFVAGVISNDGNLISISQPTGIEAGYWESIESVLRDLIVTLPEGPISTGQSWQKVTTRNLFGDDQSVPERLQNLPFYHEYTLMEIAERDGLTLARIRYHSTFEVAEILSPEEAMAPESMQVTVEATYDGDFWIDVTTGLVVEAQQTAQTRDYIAYLPPITPPEADDPLEIDYPSFLSFDEPLVLQDSDVTVYFSISQVAQ